MWFLRTVAALLTVIVFELVVVVSLIHTGVMHP